MKHWMTLSLAIALAAGGCAKDEPAAEEPAAEEPAAAETEAEAAEIPDLAPEEPATEVTGAPVPEDFEEEAARTLHLENLDAELDRLEAEIDG